METTPLNRIRRSIYRMVPALRRPRGGSATGSGDLMSVAAGVTALGVVFIIALYPPREKVAEQAVSSSVERDKLRVQGSFSFEETVWEARKPVLPKPEPKPEPEPVERAHRPAPPERPARPERQLSRQTLAVPDAPRQLETVRPAAYRKVPEEVPEPQRKVQIEQPDRSDAWRKSAELPTRTYRQPDRDRPVPGPARSISSPSAAAPVPGAARSIPSPSGPPPAARSLPSPSGPAAAAPAPAVPGPARSIPSPSGPAAASAPSVDYRPVGSIGFSDFQTSGSLAGELSRLTRIERYLSGLKEEYSFRFKSAGISAEPGRAQVAFPDGVALVITFVSGRLEDIQMFLKTGLDRELRPEQEALRGIRLLERALENMEGTSSITGSTP